MVKNKTTTSGLEWVQVIGLAERLKSDNQLRDYLLIVLGCNFGLRIGDLLKIQWKDVMNVDQFMITEQKTKKERTITINNNVKVALDFVASELAIPTENYYRYLFENRWGDPITTSFVNKRLKMIFSEYRIKVQKASSHCLRKSFAKRVYEMDGESERALIWLSEIFSHSSSKITRKYIGLTDAIISNVYQNL